MTDVADGLDGQIEIVRRTRGYRRWPDDVKTRIVAESFQPGVRVADVARRHGLASHQLSDWRRQARQVLLALPAEMMKGVVEDGGAAFVPVMVAPEEEDKRPAEGSITIEFGGGVMMRVPGDLPERTQHRAAEAGRGWQGPRWRGSVRRPGSWEAIQYRPLRRFLAHLFQPDGRLFARHADPQARLAVGVAGLELLNQVVRSPIGVTELAGRPGLRFVSHDCAPSEIGTRASRSTVRSPTPY